MPDERRCAYDAPMTSRRETFTASPESTTAAVEHPDVVAGFEQLGFSRLGRLSRVAQDEVWRWAATYPRERRDELIAHLSLPPVVLGAPDGSAFITVGWWWGMPDVRLRTALSDGSVVETVRQWDQVPVPPRAHGRIYRLGDLQQEQLLLNTPAGGRSVALAQGAPADLWREHQLHV